MVLMATNGAIIAIGANCGTPLVTMAPLASMVTIVRRVGIGKGRRKRKDGETVGDRNRDWGQSEEGAMNGCLWGKVGRVGGGQRGSGHPIG